MKSNSYYIPERCAREIKNKNKKLGCFGVYSGVTMNFEALWVVTSENWRKIEVQTRGGGKSDINHINLLLLSLCVPVIRSVRIKKIVHSRKPTRPLYQREHLDERLWFATLNQLINPDRNVMAVRVYEESLPGRSYRARTTPFADRRGRPITQFCYLNQKYLVPHVRLAVTSFFYSLIIITIIIVVQFCFFVFLEAFKI